MTDTFISVENVILDYQTGAAQRLRALDEINLAIGEGEFVSLVGPSGCGKTTLLNIIGDLLTPSAGRVQVNAQTPSELRSNREIGVIFQESVLLPWRTVGDNINFLAQLAGRPLAQPALEDVADLVKLSGWLERYPHELSGGMRQRAAVARALALNPSVLLMDEPFGALDEITRHQMNVDLLRIWSDRRKTVVFVTHSLREAVFLSDKVIVMSARPGRVVAEIPIELQRPRVESVRFEAKFIEYEAAIQEHLTSGANNEA